MSVACDEFIMGFTRFKQGGMGVLGYRDAMTLKNLSHHVRETVSTPGNIYVIQIPQPSPDSGSIYDILIIRSRYGRHATHRRWRCGMRPFT